MRQAPGLQLVDVLADELTKYYKIKDQNPSKEMRWSLRQLLIPQRIMGVRRIKYIPYWLLRLHVGPPWLYFLVMSLITRPIAYAARYHEPLWGWAFGDPTLPKKDLVTLEKLEKEWKKRNPGRP